MAKKKTAKRSGPNKSEAVRAELELAPHAPAAEIAAAASQRIGVEVLPSLVYNIRASEGLATPRKKKGRKGTRKQAGVVKSSPGGMNMKLIKEAAAFLSQAGDAKSAREALDAAAEISKALNK